MNRAALTRLRNRIDVLRCPAPCALSLGDTFPNRKSRLATILLNMQQKRNLLKYLRFSRCSTDYHRYI